MVPKATCRPQVEDGRPGHSAGSLECGVDHDRTGENLKSRNNCLDKPAPGVSVGFGKELPVVQDATVVDCVQEPLEGDGSTTVRCLARSAPRPGLSHVTCFLLLAL